MVGGGVVEEVVVGGGDVGGSVGCGDGEVDEVAVGGGDDEAGNPVGLAGVRVGSAVTDLVTDLDLADRSGGAIGHRHGCTSGEAVAAAGRRRSRLFRVVARLLGCGGDRTSGAPTTSALRGPRCCGLDRRACFSFRQAGPGFHAGPGSGFRRDDLDDLRAEPDDDLAAEFDQFPGRYQPQRREAEGEPGLFPVAFRGVPDCVGGIRSDTDHGNVAQPVEYVVAMLILLTLRRLVRSVGPVERVIVVLPAGTTRVGVLIVAERLIAVVPDRALLDDARDHPRRVGMRHRTVVGVGEPVELLGVGRVDDRVCGQETSQRRVVLPRT